MDKINEQMRALIETYGLEVVKTAAEQLLTDAGVKPLAGKIELDLVAPGVTQVVDHLVKQLMPLAMTAVQLEEKRSKGLPAEYVPILAPDLLAKTMEQLDAVGYTIEEAGSKKEAIYANKPDLVKRKRDLEGQIKALEAEAIMQIQGEGKSQYVEIAGTKVPLTNDTTRDAYRRTYTKAQREELAQVEGDIYRIEAELLPANDNWQKAVESAAIVKAKAGLQGALLNFLAAR